MGVRLATTFRLRAGANLRRLATPRPPRPALGDAPASRPAPPRNWPRPAPQLAPPTTPRQVPPPRGVTLSCPGKGGGDRGGGGGGGTATAQDPAPPAFPPRPHPALLTPPPLTRSFLPRSLKHQCRMRGPRPESEIVRIWP